MASDREKESATQPLTSGGATDSGAAEAAGPRRSNLYIGLTLKGRYLVEKELGRGGLGIVFLARDQQLHFRPVVVKVLLDEPEEMDQTLWLKKKFRQEIEALARIDHPGVVGVLDTGEMPDGKPYLVMQYVEGVNLRSVMSNEGMSFTRVADIMRQVGQALSAAHDKGVYHRDLKPENIMLQKLGGGEDLVKLIDFGVATVIDSQVAASGTATRVAGTVLYMAPEQLAGNPSPASDIYALGVITYEMLTGRRPFNPTSPFQLLELQRAGVQVKPRELLPALPEPAEAVILKALSFNPEDRYGRARDFGAELARTLTLDVELHKHTTVRLAPQRGTARQSQPDEAGRATVVDAFDPSQSPALELAHVLFADLVGYSKLPMDEQTRLLGLLQEVVRGTPEFQRAEAAGQLIRLPTGDGMALVFFGNPVAPAQCALSIARALKSYPEVKLRMGINSGPVYRIADINTNNNVAGGGINTAQRVMDCGDAGHILVSKSVADVLGQLSEWSSHLHNLGEVEVKHGVNVHLFNLYTGEAGNPALPEKVRQARGSRGAGRRAALPLFLVAAAVLTLAGVGGAAAWFYLRPKPPAPAPPAPAPVPAAPGRLLTYWVVLQKDPQRYPDSRPRPVPGRAAFFPSVGDQIRLNLTSPQEGFLYIINEGPVPTNGLPSFNVLFPYDGSAMLTPDRLIQIPATGWFVFDAESGTEKIWLVWSAKAVPALEAVKGLANPRDQGEIKDPNQIIAVQNFLTQQSANPPEVIENKERVQTKVEGKGDILVQLVEIIHHQ